MAEASAVLVPGWSRDSAAAARQPQALEPLTSFIDRQNRETSAQAQRLLAAAPDLSDRQLWTRLIVQPVAGFWSSYAAQRSAREGIGGFVANALSAWMEYLQWAKYWEARVRGGLAAGSLQRNGPTGGSLIASPALAPLPQVSVVVITRNEACRIGRCLDAVAWAGEVIVVDGESTDGTPELCRARGATVVSHAFDGSFATDRNLGLAAARGEWVLQIDADDVVTPGFHAALMRMLQAESPHAGYRFYRRSVLLGRALRHGGWHYTVPNLLRQGRARYEGLVHERPTIDGSVGTLAADIEHHPCDDLAAFVTRHNRYTTLQARELRDRLGLQPDREIGRQLRRRPRKTFWKSYVKKQGYREGLHGAVFAAFFTGVELIKWAKYWELCRPALATRSAHA